MAAGNDDLASEDRPCESEVRHQLERIIGSPEFDTSQRSSDFLRFVVEQVLAGKGEAISQHAIACQVFGRDSQFSPTTDPIVRMQAGRVRRSLEHYYLTAGSGDPVLISMAKGTYAPAFEFRQTVSPASSPAPGPAPSDGWPTLLVSPLQNLTGQPDVEFIAQGLASDLAVELNRYTGVSVFLSRGAGRERGGAPLPRFELNGKLALAAGDLRITFHLIETQSGQQTWANTYACAAGPARAAALDRIVQTTAATVAEEHGILASQLGNHPLPRSDCGSNAYEAILRHHHFELTKEPQRFAEALAALREAIQLDASCAPCWSYLARLGAVHWALDLPGDGIPIDESVAAARRGVQLAPVDVCSRAVLTYVLLLSDATDAARAEANAALQLNGMSAYWLDAIGYLLTLSGDWKQGPELIRRAVQINPFPRKACYAALWMDALRRDDPAQALSAACRHAPEFHFWGPLMEAVALVIDDNAKAAAEPARRLLEMKPDFPQRGDWLIRRYVKFDDLVRRIEQALGIAGLALDPASPTPTPAASAN